MGRFSGGTVLQNNCSATRPAYAAKISATRYRRCSGSAGSGSFSPKEVTRPIHMSRCSTDASISTLPTTTLAIACPASCQAAAWQYGLSAWSGLLWALNSVLAWLGLEVDTPLQQWPPKASLVKPRLASGSPLSISRADGPKDRWGLQNAQCNHSEYGGIVPKPRKNLEHLRLSGTLGKNPGRYANRYEPPDDRPIGEPYEWLPPAAREA